jgi:hypothetical protein
MALVWSMSRTATTTFFHMPMTNTLYYSAGPRKGITFPLLSQAITITGLDSCSLYFMNNPNRKSWRNLGIHDNYISLRTRMYISDLGKPR